MLFEGKLALPILAIKKDTLFAGDEFIGFQSAGSVDYRSRILKNYEYVIRGNAEQDLSYKQPISYVVVIRPADRRIFAYERASKFEHVTEARLHGKWSIGIGGHVDACDESVTDPLQECMRRELAEEITLVNPTDPKIIGYINNNTVEVDRYHFGILAIVATDDAFPKENSMTQGRMYLVDELDALFADPAVTIEYWSRIAYAAVKDYLLKSV